MAKFDAERIENMILDEISKPSERTKQVKIGPSEIGGCFYCIGETMSQMLPDPPKIRPDTFGLSAWRGTAIHHYIEHTFRIPDVEHERKVEIFDIEGYAKLTGTIDLWLKSYNATLDWKNLGKWSYTETTLDGPSAKYWVQQMCYGGGLVREGHTIEQVGICVIPGFSNRLEDIQFYWAEFDPQIVDNAKHNAETIWKIVQEDRWRELPSDDDCYKCETQGRMK